MSYPADNVLQSVQTLQASGLAALQNQNCAIAKSNKMFKDFDKRTANLGDTILLNEPPRSVASDGLTVSTFGGANQLVQSLTVNQAAHASFASTAQQFILNVDQFVNDFVDSNIVELGSRIEASLWRGISQTFTATNGNDQSTTVNYYGPNRINWVDAGTSGNGKCGAINTYQQFAGIIANYKNYGAAPGKPELVMPDVIVPQVVGNGLNQFVPRRNDESAMNWEVGDFTGGGQCGMNSSNLLATHISGTVGDENATVTVVGISPDGTSLDVTVGANQTFNDGDIITFEDYNAGLRFLTYTGHQPSYQYVQSSLVGNVTADGTGAATLTLRLPLIYDATGLNQNANLTMAITAGMTAKIVPSHVRGMIWHPKSFYLAMPMLPDQAPFASSSKADMSTGASLRVYNAVQPFNNLRGYVSDCIWGATLSQQYAMAIAYPLQ